MNLRQLTLFTFGGFLAGIIAFGLIMHSSMMGMMIVESKSPHDYKNTVSLLQAQLESTHWKSPKTYHLHKTLKKHGHDVLPVAVIELCQPDYAAKILAKDEYRVVSPFMPCRISVYEKSNGEVIIARMNSGLMSRFFPGSVKDVMKKAFNDNEAMVTQVLNTAKAPVTTAKN